MISVICSQAASTCNITWLLRINSLYQKHVLYWTIYKHVLPVFWYNVTISRKFCTQTSCKVLWQFYAETSCACITILRNPDMKTNIIYNIILLDSLYTNIKYVHDIGQSLHKRHEHVIICLFTTYSIYYMFMYMYYIGQSVHRRFAHYGIAGFYGGTIVLKICMEKTLINN